MYSSMFYTVMYSYGLVLGIFALLLWALNGVIQNMRNKNGLYARYGGGKIASSFYVEQMVWHGFQILLIVAVMLGTVYDYSKYRAFKKSNPAIEVSK